MKINKLWILCLLILCSCSTKNEEDIVSRGFERAELQLSAQLKVLPEPNEYPRTIKDGKLKTTKWQYLSDRKSCVLNVIPS